MIKTGSKALDDFLKGYKKEINCIYGPSASGKTTLCLLAAINLAKQENKVVFMDTENGFNIDRIRQIAGWNYISVLDKILLLKVNDFEDQWKKFEMLTKFSNINLVIVDSMTNFYRKEIHTNPEEINNKFAEQMKILNKLVRQGVYIIITSQVYNKMDEKGVSFIGGKIVQNFSKKIIELQKEPNRSLILKKPEKGNFDFKIVDEGIIPS